MGQRCPRGNCSTHTAVAKFQALSTWDPWDKPSKKAQDKPPHFSRPHSLRPHFSRSENGETSDKKTRKEKKRHRRQEQARKNSNPAADVNASSASCGARKDLSHITCFNYDKVSRAKERQGRLRRLVTVLTTSTLMTGAPCYPGTRFLYLIPGLSPKRSRRSHVGHEGQDGPYD